MPGRPQAGALARAQQTASGALGQAWGWLMMGEQKQAQGLARQMAGLAWGLVEKVLEMAAAEKASGLGQPVWARLGQGWAEEEVPG